MPSQFLLFAFLLIVTNNVLATRGLLNENLLPDVKEELQLQKRSDHSLTSWNTPTYSGYQQAPAVNMPQEYGQQNLYHPPPLPPGRGFPPETYGVHPRTFDSLNEAEEDDDGVKRKSKKGSRRSSRAKSRILDEYGQEVPAGDMGFPINGPGSPLVCGPDAEKTYGEYGGGESTVSSAQGNGYNPPTPASYRQPVSTAPGADFSKAKPCGSGSGYNPDMNDYTNVLGGGGSGGQPMRAGSHLQKHRDSGNTGAIVAGSVIGTGVVAGGAYLAHRRYKTKSSGGGSSSISHGTSDDIGEEEYVDEQYDQGESMQHHDREAAEQYHDANMYGYGHAGYGYYQR